MLFIQCGISEQALRKILNNKKKEVARWTHTLTSILGK